jgi:hypothetical protein
VVTALSNWDLFIETGSTTSCKYEREINCFMQFVIGETDYCKREKVSAHRLYRMTIKGIMKWTPEYIPGRQGEYERQTAAVG